MEDKDKDTVAIESFFVLPRNQFYWSYKINEGVLHTIKKDDIFEFLKRQVSLKNYVNLTDLLSRFRPFIILVKEDKIIELSKQEVEASYYRENIVSELRSVLDKKKFKHEKESLDKKLNKVWKKIK